MELFRLLGTIAINNEAANTALDETSEKAEGSHSKISDAFAKIGSAAVKVGKVVATGLAVCATAIATLATQSLQSYADYEQLVGGVETLFGAGGQSLEEYAASVGKTVDEVRGEYADLMQAQGMVLDDARNAYKTAGMSANEYMETVTSFSAALIQSLDGDTAAAADKANQAITDMADNANKMGSSMESIQNAYQGFAKQNYTMLDNLKLGYGGTKEEMQRLLKDAEAISGIHYDISSYADVVDAIHVIQDEMGIAGTTAKEASETISGSVSSMKSAWSNLVAGLGDENANLNGLIDQFIESAMVALDNIMPRLEVILSGISDVIAKIIPKIAAKLPGLLQSMLPSLIEGATGLFAGLVSALPTLLQILIEQLPFIVSQLASALVSSFPLLLDAVKQLFVQIASLIFGESATIGDSVGGICDVFIDSFGSLWNSLSGIFSQIAPLFSRIAETILPMMAESLGLIIPPLVELVQAILPVMMDAISQIVPFLLQIAEQIFPILFDVLSQLIPVFMQIAQAILPVVTQLVTQLLPVLMQIIQAILGVVQQLIPPIMQMIEAILPVIMTLIDALITILTPLINLIGAIMTPLIELIGAILTPIINLISQLVTWLAEKLKPVFEVIANVISTVLNAAFESIAPIVEGVRDFLSSAWEAISTRVSTVFNAIKSVVSKVWNAISSVVTKVVGGIRDGITTAFNKIKSVITGIMDTISTVISNIWNGIWGTIKGVVNWILGGIEGMVNGVIRGINKVLGGIDSVVSGVGDLIGLNWSVPTLNEISLPRLEKGGVLEKGQVGLLEGNGAEAVVPLEKNREWIARVSEEMSVQGIGGGSGDETLSVLQAILQALKDMNLDLSNLPDTLLDAIANGLTFNINNREFARLVKAV